MTIVLTVNKKCRYFHIFRKYGKMAMYGIGNARLSIALLVSI